MNYSNIPPCPGDPRNFTLYKDKNGKYRWQAKRGTYTPVRLNSTFEANTKSLTIGSKLASAIAAILACFVKDFSKDGLQGDLTGRLMRESNSGKGLRLRSLIGTELQPDYPLDSLLNVHPTVNANLRSKKLRITIKLPDEQPAVRVYNKLFTGYRFLAVLVYGELQSKDVQEAHVSSPIYTGTEPAQDCVLELDYSKLAGDYLLCLRVESYEGAELAAHRKTRAMQIIASGRLHTRERPAQAVRENK
jgi:hypothetical protein